MNRSTVSNSLISLVEALQKLIPGNEEDTRLWDHLADEIHKFWKIGPEGKMTMDQTAMGLRIGLSMAIASALQLEKAGVIPSIPYDS